ncbi:MAG: tetratricopeptide repeat protein [Candidatus Omnitrophica bacterium]|nr:tetratricopeptide repeat protein [Candidatus Omnitrophota bacterium]
MDYSIWQLDPKGYHLTNILIHLLVALAIYFLIIAIINDHVISLFAALLFVVHPLNVETVASISDRADSLAALFMLLSIIFYLKYLKQQNGKGSILIGTSYLLAILSKENSLAVPALLLAYHYIFKKKINVKNFFIIVGIILTYLVFRLALIKVTPVNSLSITLLLQRIPGFFAAIFSYLRIILFPFNLHMEYSYKLFHFTDPRTILGLTAAIFLLLFAIKKKNSNDFMRFSLLWFFIALMPVANIYPFNESYMAERWLYFPSIGILFIFAEQISLMRQIRRLRSIATCIFICLLMFYAILTMKQNKYWSHPIIFFERTLKYNPESGKAYNELALEYEEVGRFKEAVSAYKNAIKYMPDALGAYFNLANLYRRLGKKEESANIYNKAIEIKKRIIQQHYEAAKQYGEKGNYRKAIASYQEALFVEPNSLLLSSNLSNLYIITGHHRKAIQLLTEVLSHNPNFSLLHNNLSLAYYYTKQYELAIKHCDRAIALGYEVSPKLLELLKPYRK